MFFELKSRKCYSNHTITQILTITGKIFSYSSLAELKYKTSVNKTFDYQFIFTFKFYNSIYWLHPLLLTSL